jgi:hypothetical protein
MRITVTETPRRIARISRNTPVLLRIISGSVRVSADPADLHSGFGLPLAQADGIQNWIMPEGELWIAADAGGATMEVILP